MECRVTSHEEVRKEIWVQQGSQVSSVGEITGILEEWNAGNPEALHRLTEKVYDQLRSLAYQILERDWGSKSLQATELVHEAFLRLLMVRQCKWVDSGHFFGIVARLMRQILVDRARLRLAAKRGGGAQIISLQSDNVDAPDHVGVSMDLVALDLALKELAEQDEDLCRLVELRFFAGMTLEETGELLGVSARTVNRDWRLAKAWLKWRLNGSEVRRGGVFRE